MTLLTEHPVIVQSIVFLAVAGTLLIIGSLRARKLGLIEDRLRSLKERGIDASAKLEALSSLGRRNTEASDPLLIHGLKRHPRLQARFVQAGIRELWVLSIYILAQCALAIALPLAVLAAVPWGILPLPHALVGCLPAALLGFLLPHLWLERRRAHRHLLLRRAIPDFLDLVVACLSGGLSVQAALRQVAEELRLAHPELSEELNIVLREIELGGTLDHALGQLATRTGVDELRTLRTFVQQTTKFGTTITDALAQLAEMLRMQREQRAEELAQKAAVKILFPTMLFIFPTIFVVLAGPAAIQINEGLLASMRQQSAGKN